MQILSTRSKVQVQEDSMKVLLLINDVNYMSMTVLYRVHTSSTVKGSLSYCLIWVLIYSTTVIDISSNKLIHPQVHYPR
jgi:hypothetical protein